MREVWTASVAIVMALACALAGCNVGPDYQTPVVISPAVWGGEPAAAHGTTAGPVDPRWWDSFHDPELSSLVARLVAQNIDLQTAAERVRQSQDQVEIARSEGLPHVDEQSSYRHERQSPSGFISLVEPAPFAPLTYDIWQNGLQASWEIDLFGRVRRAVEAQRADTLAAIEARHEVAIDAIADLAQDYMQLRGTQTLLIIARRNLGIAQKSAALVQDQFHNGVATVLTVAQAQAQVATTGSVVPPLEAQEARLANAIGLLLALPPRALETELERAGPPVLVPPSVPVGFPSTLVERRPDIRQAEARLHAATAQTGVAVANFYPDLSLTGQFEDQGRIIANAFSLPSRAFMLGPSVDLPIFEGGRLRGTLRLRRSEQKEAALQFQQTVLAAWRDVDDALTAYAQAQAQNTRFVEAVTQDRRALTAAEQAYALGASDFLNVTSAEAALLSSENSLAQSDTTIETDLVGLFKALGGGWDVADRGAAVRP